MCILYHVHSEPGNECTEPSEIMTKVKVFYSNLYKHCSMKTKEDCVEYSCMLNTLQFSEGKCISCKGSLTERE